MGEILQFPEKPKGQDLATACGGVWTCGCGAQDWRLYGNGIVLCNGCHYVSTVLKVIQEPVPPDSAGEKHDGG